MEPVKIPRSTRNQGSLKIPPGSLLHDTPETSDSLEGTNYLKSDARQNADIDDSSQSELPNYLKSPQDRDSSDNIAPAADEDHSDTHDARADDNASSRENALERVDHDTDRSSHTSHASDLPSLTGALKAPLLAIGAGVAVLAAAWNYTALEDARTKLTAVTEAKAAVERDLANAQGRLSAAEKAIASVQAALASSPAIAAPDKAAAAAAPAAAEAPAAAAAASEAAPAAEAPAADASAAGTTVAPANAAPAAPTSQ